MPETGDRGRAGRVTGENDLPIVRLRHWGRIPLAVVLLAALGGLLYAVATNKHIDWGIVAQNLTAAAILKGVGVTILLTVISMAIGIVLGTVTAILRGSDNPVLSTLARGYIAVFRGTPVLVQLIFWYNLGLLFPVIGFGSFGIETNVLITGFTAALLGLGLNEGAYMAEIVRAGLLSVDPGQTEASLAVGMTKGQTLRTVVLPQALRVIVPPTGNEIITMLKTTSLVSVISGSDLLTSAQVIYSRNFAVIELLIVVSIWYLALTALLTGGQWLLERRLARGRGSTVPARSAGRRA